MIRQFTIPQQKAAIFAMAAYCFFHFKVKSYFLSSGDFLVESCFFC